MARARNKTFFSLFLSLALLVFLVQPLTSSPPSLAEEPQGWYPQDPGTMVHLMAVGAVDEMTAWVTGYNGTILKTTDGGATWRAQNSGVTAELRSLSVVSHQTAWVAGEVLLRTSDGGNTWSKLSLGRNFYPFYVCAVNASVAWVAGNYWVSSLGDYRREVRRTTDGGRTWTTHVLPTGEPLNDLCAVDTDTAWVACNNGLLLKTTDGGRTWQNQSTGTGDTLMDLEALDARTAYGVSGNRVYKTTDGGSTWTFSETGSPYLHRLQALEVVDGSTLWAVGENGLIVKSTDGGHTWTTQRPQDPDLRTYYDISAVNADVAWIAGSDGRILHTVNGGAEPPPVPEITSITPASGYPLSTASIGGENFGSRPSPESYGKDSWLSLGAQTVPLNNILDWQDNSIVFRIPSGLSPGTVETSVTVNGLTSNKVDFTVLEPPTRGWRLQDPGTNAILFSVSAADADTAWAVGLGGTILKTTDGGATWRPQDSGVTNNLLAVAAASPQVAWAGGEEALLLTVDGGATWHVVSSQPGYCVYDIAAVDENNCWVVGGGLPNASLDRGFIIRTRDGGSSWEVQVLNHHHNLYSIAAADGANAWVAGGEIMYLGTTGVILRTTDGGAHWASSGPTDRSWWRIAACDAQNAMVWGTSVEGSWPSVKINPECRKTADGGTSWTALSPAQTAGIYVPQSGAEMLDPQDIWVASSAGWPPYTGIARTVNGGVSWSYQLDGYLSYPHVQTTDISAVDGDTAWAVGGYTILHTTDGGYMGPAPVIHSLSPASGGGNDPVTIEGANFGSGQGRSTVIFGDRPASVESWTDTEIVCRAPEMGSTALRVPVFVTTSSGTSNSVQFNYGTGFTVLSIQPDQGSQLAFSLNATIEGSGFLPGAAARLEKGAAVITATGVNVTSESRIECALVTWGAEPGSYDVVVVNPDGSEARLPGGFTVTSACGTGSGAALLMLGLCMGLVSLLGWRGKSRRRGGSPGP